MKRTLTLACAILTVALLTAPATAGIYYVRNAAAGTADGSDWNNAFGTIQGAWDAINKTVGDHSIYIEKSTGSQEYAGAGHNWFQDNNTYINMNHYGGYTVTGGVGVKNDGDISKVVNSSGVAFAPTGTSRVRNQMWRFDDMDITGSAGAVDMSNTRYLPILEGNRTVFRSTSASSSDLAVLSMVYRGADYVQGGRVELDRCLVTGGVSGGIDGKVRDTGSMMKDMKVLLTNTAIVDTGDFGIYAKGNSMTSGGGATVDLDHVTISGVSDTAVIFGKSRPSTASAHNWLKVDHSLLYPNNAGAIMFRDDLSTGSKFYMQGDGNAFYDYSGTIYSAALLNPAYVYYQITNTDDQSTGDPMVGADGFHLLAGSPMIDVAAGSFIAPLDVDYDGESRPDGTHYDIGADEYVPEPATMGLLGLGFAGMAVLRKRRRRA